MGEPEHRSFRLMRQSIECEKQAPQKPHGHLCGNLTRPWPIFKRGLSLALQLKSSPAQRPPLRRLRNQIAVPRSRTIRTSHHQSPASPLKSGGGCAVAGEARRRARAISAVKLRHCMLVAPCREAGSGGFLVQWTGAPATNGMWRSSCIRGSEITYKHMLNGFVTPVHAVAARRVADRAEGRHARGSAPTAS